MSNKNLKVSLTELAISIALACILPAVINYGIFTFGSHPESSFSARISFICGALSLLSGLAVPIPLLGTSLLLGGSILVIETYLVGFFGTIPFSNINLLLAMIGMLGILLWQLHFCYFAKKQLQANESSKYSALAIREGSLSIIVPIILPIITRLVEDILHTAITPNFTVYSYIIVGIVSLILGLVQAIPSISMSLALASCTLVLSFRLRELINPTVAWLLAFCYGAALLFMYRNREKMAKSYFILIRNLAIVIMFIYLLPLAVSRALKQLSTHLSSTAILGSYLVIAIIISITGVLLGSNYLGFGLVLSGAGVILRGLLQQHVGSVVIFLVLTLITIFLGFALWKITKKQNNHDALK